MRIVPWLFIGSFVARVLVSFSPSYKIDMGGYVAWSHFLADRGLEGFYGNFHVVYGPVYLYMLWISGKLMHVFGATGVGQEFLVKIWSVIFDYLGAWIIARIGSDHGQKRAGWILALCYVLNPAIVFNSSVWGQFDSVFATILMASVYAFLRNRKAAAVILYGVAVLTKPQSALLLPVVVVAFLHGLSWHTFGAFVKLCVRAIIPGALVYFVLTYPFAAGRGLFWIIGHSLQSANDYPYATANGFNFWTLVGGQVMADREPWLLLTYAKWAYVFLGLVAGVSMLLAWKGKDRVLSLVYAAFFMNLGAFVFFTRMHERYLLPAIIFGMAAVCFNRALAWVVGAVSLCCFVNHLVIYEMAKKEIFWIGPRDPIAYVVAAVTVALTAVALVQGVLMLRPTSVEPSPSQ